MTVLETSIMFGRERYGRSASGPRSLESPEEIKSGAILEALTVRPDFFDLTTVQGLRIPHTSIKVPFIPVAAVDLTKQLPSFDHKPSNDELMVAIKKMAISAEGRTVNLRTPSLEHERKSLKADGVVIFVNVKGESVQVMNLWTRRAFLKLAGVTGAALAAACAGLAPRKPPDVPPTGVPFPTRTPVPTASKTEVPKTSEPVPTSSPDGYSASDLLGSKDVYNTVAEAIDKAGNPTEATNNRFIKAHKFSEADLQAIVESGTPQYGIDTITAQIKLDEMKLIQNLTAVNVPAGQVYYFSNGLAGDAFRGFTLLVSADGNSVWLAKNKATGALNYYPNTFSGINLEKNYTPAQLAQMIRPWQPADAEPQEADRLITRVDISVIGGVDNLNVVFQNGTENAYLIDASNLVKSGVDVIMSVFDVNTGKWLDILDIPQDAILPSEWAVVTEGENEGKYNPELFFQLVGSINHQNRKTVSLESDGLKIAFTAAEQYFKDNNIDPILGLTALSEADQQALAEALSLQLDNMADLKAQLSAIRTQIAANEGGGPLLSKDISRYTVIIQNGQVTGIVFYTGLDVTRRYALNAEGKLVKLASELEPQLLPELTVDGPYIKRADTGEIVQLKGLSIHNPFHDSGPTPLDKAINNIHLAKSWGSNLIRLQYATSSILSHLSDVDRIVQEANENGMYVVFSPTSIKPGDYPDRPTQDVIDVNVKLAQHLLPYKHVILDILNEPTNNVSWEDLYSDVTISIKRLREVNPNLVIGVPGREWSRDFTFYLSHPLPFDNLLYSVHNNPYVDPSWTTIPEGWVTDRSYMFKMLLGQHPIIFGEFNYPGSSPFDNSPEETKWMDGTFKLVNDNTLGYTGYSLVGGEGTPLDIVTPSGNLTVRGQNIVNDLKQFPPTQFDH